MRLIRTNDNHIINVDGQIKQGGHGHYCWGYRWNRNTGQFGKQCIEWHFKNYSDVSAAELTVVKPLELD